MPIQGLDHFTVHTADRPGTVDFYCRVLGFSTGARPPFAFPGEWLYIDGRPLLHLVDNPDAPGGRSSLDHVALAIDDPEAMAARLDANGVPYEARGVPGSDRVQYFLHDPNGVKIELQFTAKAGMSRPPPGLKPA
ncbi:MAG: VOC family protein [Thalassobaculales bacterium]